jgi:hypothetical protein
MYYDFTTEVTNDKKNSNIFQGAWREHYKKKGI